MDPVQGVLCYHNMQTREKVYDYQMKKKKLKEINAVNIVFEAEYEARLQAHSKCEAVHSFIHSFIHNQSQVET